MLIRVNCSSLISLQHSASLPTQKAPARCCWKGFGCQTQWRKLCPHGAVPPSHQQLLALPWHEAELNPWSAEPLHLGFPSFHPPKLRREESSREDRQPRVLEGGSQPPVMLGMCREGRRPGETPPALLLWGGVKAGRGGEKEGQSKGHQGWKDLNHQLMNFNPRSNMPSLGSGAVLPFWYPRSLCRLREDLAGKCLKRYLTKYLRFSLIACAPLINTQLKWKLFLFPPLLFINRKRDQFWTLRLFTMK